MRKIHIYLFVAAISVAFTSCNKTVKSRLPGSWTITKQNVTTVQTIGGGTFTNNASNGGGNYTFKSDGTGSTNNNSNGKTTTKEMIATVLEPRYRVLKNRLNLNNLIGMPLTLLELVLSIEEVLEVRIENEELANIRTLAQLKEFLRQRSVSAQSKPA